MVTLNRLELLKRCLAALRSQTRPPDGIIVVDNGSSDGTREWLSNQPDVQTVFQDNRGSAGGFASGIAKAEESGYSHYFLLDDDGWPEPGCLEELCRCASRHSAGYVASNLFDGEQPFFSELFARCPKEVVPFEGGPFNGILVDAGMIRQIGNINPGYFFQGDEYEFVDRVKFAGELCLTARDARFHHPRAVPCFGRLGQRGYYLGRNTAWRLRSFRRGAVPAAAFYSLTVWKLLKQLSQSVRSGDLKGAVIILGGIFSGFTNPVPQMPPRS